MSISGPKAGVWWLTSKKDPRWNAQGRTQTLQFPAGLPPEAKAHLDNLKKILGKPPEDLEFGGMKD